MLYRDPNLSQLAIGSPVLPMQWPLARLFVRSTNGRCARSVALQSTIGKQAHARRQSNPGLVGFGFVMPTAWHRRCQQDYSMIRRDHHVLDRRALAPPTIVGVPAAFVFWPADRPLRAVEQYFPNLGHGRQHFRELSPMTRRQMHCHKLLQHRQQPSDPFANLWLAQSKETAHHILSRIGFEIEQNEEQLSFGLRQHTFSTPADRTLAAMPFDGLLRRLGVRCSLPKGKQSLKCICAHARQRPHPSFISQGMLNRNHAIKITRADFYALLPIFSSELLPQQAKIADKFAVVRSATWEEPDHQRIEIFTGFPKRQRRPSFGSYVSRLAQQRDTGLPKFVSLKGDDLEIAEAEQPLWVGAQHRAFVPNNQGLRTLELSRQVDLSRLKSRKDLLTQLDTLRREGAASGEMRAMDTFSGQALDMLTSGKARRAFDLSEEKPQTLERYRAGGNRFMYSHSSTPVSWECE